MGEFIVKPLQGVIFDMDGLIFDSERICYQAYLRAARKFGFQMNYLVHFDLTGRTEAGVVSETKRLYGQDKDVLAWRKYIGEQKIAIRAEQGGHVGVKAGLGELLAFLQQHKMPYAIASSSTRPVIDSYLEVEGLADQFSVIMDGSQVVNGKPDPEIFLKAAAKLGIEPSAILVLEDSRAGIQAAKAGGFSAGYVYDSLEDLEEISEGSPILVDLDSPAVMHDEADYLLDTLADAIGVIERSQSDVS